VSNRYYGSYTIWHIRSTRRAVLSPSRHYSFRRYTLLYFVDKETINLFDVFDLYVRQYIVAVFGQM